MTRHRNKNLDGPCLQDDRPPERTVQDYTALIARLDEQEGFAADKLLTFYNRPLS